MITDSRNLRACINSNNAKPIDAIGSWIRDGRLPRPVVVKFPPAVEFVVPIDYELIPQYRPAPDLALAEAGESLVLA